MNAQKWPIWVRTYPRSPQHRIARAMLDGKREVSAVRFLTLPEPDYRDCQPADLPY